MLEELVTSLLYEGYALYPYTPGATKNATPTPFGIVYPPVYAAECPGAFDHARLECFAEGASSVKATLRFLRPRGVRHEAIEQRMELGPVAIGERATETFDAALHAALRRCPGARRTCRGSAPVCTTPRRYELGLTAPALW